MSCEKARLNAEADEKARLNAEADEEARLNAEADEEDFGDGSGAVCLASTFVTAETAEKQAQAQKLMQLESPWRLSHTPVHSITPATTGSRCHGM